MKHDEIKKDEIIIYNTKEGPKLEVRFQKDTIWLTQKQIATLFGTQRPAISKHLTNIFKSKELEEKVVSSILEHTTQHGAMKGKTQTKDIKFYNLDAIISIGYRVNSKQATKFRIWATKTIKEHLIKGYSINENKLIQTQNNFKDLQETISLLQEKSKYKLLVDQGQDILNLLSSYAKTLTLLEQYDREKIPLIKKTKGKFILNEDAAGEVIKTIKKEFIAKGEISHLFGQENGDKLKAILGNIYQTFSGNELYPSLEEKAAHLLYFIIKDHPFIDGNKRIASFLFVYFLDKNKYLYKMNGENKINDNALITLSLLVAVSNPNEKDKIIKIITNLISI